LGTDVTADRVNCHSALLISSAGFWRRTTGRKRRNIILRKKWRGKGEKGVDESKWEKIIKVFRVLAFRFLT